MPENNIDSTLAERGSRYGEFHEHARIAQNIKGAMTDSPNWAVLAPDQRECLEMLAHKVARILNGDPNYHDSWHDMVGYSKLVADRILQDQEKIDGQQAQHPIARHLELRTSPGSTGTPSGVVSHRADPFLTRTVGFPEDAGEPLFVELNHAIKETASCG